MGANNQKIDTAVEHLATFISYCNCMTSEEYREAFEALRFIESQFRNNKE